MGENSIRRWDLTAIFTAICALTAFIHTVSAHTGTAQMVCDTALRTETLMHSQMHLNTPVYTHVHIYVFTFVMIHSLLLVFV